MVIKKCHICGRKTPRKSTRCQWCDEIARNILMFLDCPVGCSFAIVNMKAFLDGFDYANTAISEDGP